MPRKPERLPEKVLARGRDVSEAEVSTYVPDEQDLRIVELFLDGVHKTSDLAQELEIKPGALRQRLLDPVRAAWISRELNHQVRHRLGLVNAAVFLAALRSGDPRRAEYLHRQYGKIKDPVERHMNLNLNLDLSQLSNEELTLFIKEHQRLLGKGETK